MISEYEYIEACRIVEKYNRQQKLEIERLSNGDVNIYELVSKRIRTVLDRHNDNCTEGEELYYRSDFLKLIKKDGRVWDGGTYPAIFRIGRDIHNTNSGLGKKSYNELMSHIESHL